MLKTYRARRMSPNPVIDADWSKPVWNDAQIVTLDYFMGDKPSHHPKVQARLAYDSHFLYGIWRVDDNYVLARSPGHQHYVCVDSCVEFFFTPGGDPEQAGYFNLETNCAGTMWFAAHLPGQPDAMFTPDEIAQVTIGTSLKGRIDPEIAKPTPWTLEFKFPIALLEKYSKIQRPAPGVSWRANLYKCADDSSHPHWLTWSEVIWPRPSFHVTKFFGVLSFE